jgi:hypothetical protein
MAQYWSTDGHTKHQKTVTYCCPFSTCMCFGMFNLHQFESCPSECWSRNGECSKITQQPSTAKTGNMLKSTAYPLSIKRGTGKSTMYRYFPSKPRRFMPFWVISQPCFITRGSANPHAILRSGSSDWLVPQRIALLWRAVGVA